MSWKHMTQISIMTTTSNKGRTVSDNGGQVRDDVAPDKWFLFEFRLRTMNIEVQLNISDGFHHVKTLYLSQMTKGIQFMNFRTELLMCVARKMATFVFLNYLHYSEPNRKTWNIPNRRRQSKLNCIRHSHTLWSQCTSRCVQLRCTNIEIVIVFNEFSL